MHLKCAQKIPISSNPSLNLEYSRNFYGIQQLNTPELTSIMAFILLSITVQTKNRFEILTIKSNLHILRGTRHLTFKLNQPPSRLFYVLSSFLRLVFEKVTTLAPIYVNSKPKLGVCCRKCMRKMRLFQENPHKNDANFRAVVMSHKQ